MNLAQSERAELCSLLAERGPDAPTLCEGWDTHALAAHLWVRESDPLAAPGIMIKPLAGLTERRMSDVEEKWSYDELVTRLKDGPTSLSLFAIPGIDEMANGLEYFVHHEDVRRAGENADATSRELGGDVEDMMWRRLKLMGRVLLRRAGVGIVLERSDADHESARVVPGEQTVTLTGKPSELMLLAYGRAGVAQVERVGEPEALDALAQADLAL